VRDRRSPAAAIVVLAKYPTPGRVKTRLAAAIGTASACRLYAAFIRDLRARLREWDGPVWWAFTPARAPFPRLVGSRRCFPQRGADLGVRIHHAIAEVARRTSGPVLALGADAPHVSLRALERAARGLARGTDVALGPAADGGYYLIGLARPTPALFADVPWSTAEVAEATRRRCRELGLSLLEVDRGFDVDGVDDLRALAAVVRRRPGELVHTGAAIRAITREAGWPRPGASPSSDCARR
jgi:hypothetical protein